jgi:hypothetical protein
MICANIQLAASPIYSKCKIPGSQTDFTKSKILCNVKLSRQATFPRHLLNIQRQDILLENNLSISYYRRICPSEIIYTVDSRVKFQIAIKENQSGITNLLF